MAGHLNIQIQSPSLEFNSLKQFAPSTLVMELKRKLELVVGMYKDDMVLSLLNPEGKFERDIVEEGATLEEIGARNDWIIKVTNKNGDLLKFDGAEKFNIPDDKYAEREDNARAFLAKVKEQPKPFVKFGSRVIVKVKGKEDRVGTIRYVGEVHFKPNELMVGVELDQATGKNDGEVEGRRYFQCAPNHGVFVTARSVYPLDTIPINGNSHQTQLPMEFD
ncbi:unnamed protein product [Bursaphelenchus xylophilus]|uniref:(pine wood nematode) hypothetical protein n=1 Tax=Bursaphelenchus xylophilus TaxID=6326 RepID=A0A1I7SCT4_BURXY|nr:unnamed protein product [Bursaphelenchus xylophilus]CAG9093529.1 unnamed protein product [Bursaphelenchus xylophilus]